jgi:hypothetical protein
MHGEYKPVTNGFEYVATGYKLGLVVSAPAYNLVSNWLKSCTLTHCLEVMPGIPSNIIICMNRIIQSVLHVI